MRLPWHRDVKRTCLRCGESWRVPYGLAKRYRPGKWRVGVAPGDHFAMGGLFTASIEDQLDMAAQKAAGAYRQMATTDSVRRCPKCGSGAYRERKVARTVEREA